MELPKRSTSYFNSSSRPCPSGFRDPMWTSPSSSSFSATPLTGSIPYAQNSQNSRTYCSVSRKSMFNVKITFLLFLLWDLQESKGNWRWLMPLIAYFLRTLFCGFLLDKHLIPPLLKLFSSQLDSSRVKDLEVDLAHPLVLIISIHFWLYLI